MRLDVRAGSIRREVPAGAVLGLPGRPSADARREGVGALMMPEHLVSRWEAAYRQYGQASRSAASSVAGDRNAAQAMASASWEVAAVWREMESLSDLPWWVLAAVGAAAQAFEFQARDWNARAELDGSGRARPQPRPTPRRRPTPHRATPQDVPGSGEQSW